MAEVLAGVRRVEDINPGIIVHHKKELTPENINDPAVALSFDNLELLCDEHHNRQHKGRRSEKRSSHYGRSRPGVDPDGER